MGGRLSKPRAADGMSELPQALSGAASARNPRNRGIINGRTVMTPLAALTMAVIVFAYTRTSIHAAKLNAQKHREADGGQMNWYQESRRHHGHAERLEHNSFRDALVAEVKGEKKIGAKRKGEEAVEGVNRTERSAGEKELRKVMGRDD